MRVGFPCGVKATAISGVFMKFQRREHPGGGQFSGGQDESLRERALSRGGRPGRAGDGGWEGGT